MGKREVMINTAGSAASAVLCSFLSCFSISAHASPGYRIVIDPGHGGTDQGTVFQKGAVRVTEKEVTLKLATETARQLRNKGFLVTLTHTRDQDLSLPARTHLANSIPADLFISIHMNSLENPGNAAEGIETYILNNATDATSKRLAYFENAGHSVVKPMPGNSPGNTDEPNDVALILKDLTLDANLSESKCLACAIQNSQVSVTTPALGNPNPIQRNRGVKQALFYVLLGADMPSILVEAGFLTSYRDRTLVTSLHGQRAVGAAIVRAVEQFRRTKNTPEAQSELSRCKVH